MNYKQKIVMTIATVILGMTFPYAPWRSYVPLRNIPRTPNPGPEIAALACGSCAVTGPAFLGDAGPFRGWGLAVTTVHKMNLLDRAERGL